MSDNKDGIQFDEFIQLFNLSDFVHFDNKYITSEIENVKKVAT